MQAAKAQPLIFQNTRPYPKGLRQQHLSTEDTITVCYRHETSLPHCAMCSQMKRWAGHCYNSWCRVISFPGTIGGCCSVNTRIMTELMALGGKALPPGQVMRALPPLTGQHPLCLSSFLPSIIM